MREVTKAIRLERKALAIKRKELQAKLDEIAGEDAKLERALRDLSGESAASNNTRTRGPDQRPRRSFQRSYNSVERFLRERPAKEFRPGEIAETLDMPRSSVIAVASRLFDEGKASRSGVKRSTNNPIRYQHKAVAVEAGRGVRE